MGLFDTLFGRGKLRKPNREQFFSITTAAYSLQGRTNIRPATEAGLVFNPTESTFFENLDKEIRQLLRISGHATGTRYEIKDDNYGTRWAILDDKDFEDLVSTIHLVSETIFDHGFGDRLLATVFKFEYEKRKVYWIYNYKRGAFYTFAPVEQNRRDNATEMRLAAIMKSEKIPMEKSLEQWYALWGIPF